MTLPAWRYDDLVREALGTIPAHAPQWTDHNPSDPGITLVELMAYFTEALVWRLGRVTPQARLQFLRLLVGSPQAQADDGDVDAEIARVVDAMSRGGCAVTAADFERLARDAARAQVGPGQAVEALCLSGEVLVRRVGRRAAARSRVAVVLLPRFDLDGAEMARLCERVRGTLQPRCLLGTRVQVLPPVRLHLGIGFRVALRRGVRRQTALDAIAERLRSPPQGWGAAVRLNDVVELIDGTEGVDHVEQLVLSALSDAAERLADAASGVGVQIGLRSTPGVDARLGVPAPLDPRRLRRDAGGRLDAVALEPWEIAQLHLASEAVHVVHSESRDGGA